MFRALNVQGVLGAVVLDGRGRPWITRKYRYNSDIQYVHVMMLVVIKSPVGCICSNQL